MLSFESDYNNGAHPVVLQHLVETNDVTSLTSDKDEKNDVSICYCVRNSIDHPCKKNLHYQNDQWVNLSTKILYSLLKTINRIKKDKISSLLQSLHNSKTV